MSPWKRRFLLETIIFRIHVKFRGCNSITPGVEALGHLGWHHLRTLVAWQRLILHHIFRPQGQGDRHGQHPPKHGSKFFANNGKIQETRSFFQRIWSGNFAKNVGGLGCGSPGLTHVHPIWGARIANAPHKESEYVTLKIHGQKFLGYFHLKKIHLDFFCRQRLFWEFLHPLHPPNSNQINRKWHRQFVQRYHGISSTIFWYPWPKSSNFEGCVCSQSISSKWLSEAVIRHLPGENYHPSFSLVFGCFENKTFQRHGGVLKRDPLSNVDTSQFSSKHPQTRISSRSFLFQKLWVRQVGPKNITTKNQKPVEIWELSKDRNVSRCDDVMASGSDIYKD